MKLCRLLCVLIVLRFGCSYRWNVLLRMIWVLILCSLCGWIVFMVLYVLIGMKIGVLIVLWLSFMWLWCVWLLVVSSLNLSLLVGWFCMGVCVLWDEFLVIVLCFLLLENSLVYVGNVVGKFGGGEKMGDVLGG